MTYLLDTSALLAHVRREAEGPRVQDLFDREDADLLLCSVSLPELARRLRELGATESRIEQIIGDYEDLAADIVPVDAEVARRADQITRLSGQRLPLTDALIAGAAASRGAVLVHRDAHLRSLPPSEVAQLDLAATKAP